MLPDCPCQPIFLSAFNILGGIPPAPDWQKSPGQLPTSWLHQIISNTQLCTVKHSSMTKTGVLEKTTCSAYAEALWCRWTMCDEDRRAWEDNVQCLCRGFMMPLNYVWRRQACVRRQRAVLTPRLCDAVELCVTLYLVCVCVWMCTQSGYYIPDVNVVRERYRAVTPPLQDLTSLGFNIWMECSSYDTYRLVREGEPIGQSTSMSIIDLYSAESWSISTVLSGNDKIGSFLVIDWSCFWWASGHGDCPVVSSRPSDLRQRRPDDRKCWASNVVRSGDVKWLTADRSHVLPVH